MKHRRKRGALARRYGHFAVVANVPSDARAFIRRNPLVSAAAIGGAISVIGAGSTPLTAGLIGAMSAVTTRQIAKWADDDGGEPL
jgi:hypothetical protein